MGNNADKRQRQRSSQDLNTQGRGDNCIWMGDINVITEGKQDTGGQNQEGQVNQEGTTQEVINGIHTGQDTSE